MIVAPPATNANVQGTTNLQPIPNNTSLDDVRSTSWMGRFLRVLPDITSGLTNVIKLTVGSMLFHIQNTQNMPGSLSGATWTSLSSALAGVGATLLLNRAQNTVTNLFKKSIEPFNPTTNYKNLGNRTIAYAAPILLELSSLGLHIATLFLMMERDGTTGFTPKIAFAPQYAAWGTIVNLPLVLANTIITLKALHHTESEETIAQGKIRDLTRSRASNA